MDEFSGRKLPFQPSSEVLVSARTNRAAQVLLRSRCFISRAGVARVASVIWIALAGLFLAAAIIDGRTYRIPNWIPLALTVLFVVAMLASGKPAVGYWPHAALAAGMLALGYGLYVFTGMGAGDAKLAAAAALWVGFDGLYAWVFSLALSMAALALGLVAVRTAAATARHTPGLRMFQRGAPVPLGIALAAATVLASWQFDRALWAF